MDPREAYSPAKKLDEEAKLAAKVEYDADIKFILSRENKLARDAGHVVGELRRRKRKEWKHADQMRRGYLRARQNYFSELEKVAKEGQIPTRNIDTLVLRGDAILEGLVVKTRKHIGLMQRRFNAERESYVEFIADQMLKLFGGEWVSRK